MTNREDVKQSCLIVDDNDEFREVMRDVLLSADWEVEEAVNGDEALQKINDDGFSVVLLDILMPQKDGLEVLLELEKRPQSARPRIVAMSGGGSKVTGSLALQLAKGLGAKKLLLKPFSLKELHEAME